jgi:hypothetical protein
MIITHRPSRTRRAWSRVRPFFYTDAGRRVEPRFYIKVLIRMLQVKEIARVILGLNCDSSADSNQPSSLWIPKMTRGNSKSDLCNRLCCKFQLSINGPIQPLSIYGHLRLKCITKAQVAK